MVLDVPGLQHAAGLGVVVGVNNPIFVLLLLLIFPFLPLFSFIFIYVLLITLY